MSVANMLRVVLHWSGLGEEGSIGFNYVGSQASHTEAQLADAIGAADVLLNTSTTPSTWTNLATLLYTSQKFDSLTLYEYDLASEPASRSAQLVVSHPGTIATAGPTLQQALVVSTLTGASGARNRGRQYWPGQKYNVQPSNGLIQSTLADQMVGYAASFNDDVRSGLSGSLDIAALNLSVYSRASDSSRPVTSMVVDNRLDTQRRRAQSLTPTYRATQTIVVM